MWQTILGTIGALALAALLARQFFDAMRRRREEPERLFAKVMGVLKEPRILPGNTVGSHRLVGRLQGLEVQVQTVADTLNTRKLPSLWMMVTVVDPLPVGATFDLMMRPAGPSTFSNYEHLPEVVGTPRGFPEQAIIRSDNAGAMVPPEVVRPHIAPFFEAGPKELLVSPKGLRMVTQLGEADRARYVVLRQAEFGETQVEEAELRGCLDLLFALRKEVLAWQTKT